MINAIMAVDANLGLGFENGLPWPTHKEDMKWFANNTLDGVVLMGRKTWESLGYMSLPSRVNVVVSSEYVGGADCVVNGDMGVILTDLEKQYPNKDIWVIGGADVYHQALPYCDKLYITRMKHAHRCDTFICGRDLDRFEVTAYEEKYDDFTIQIRLPVST